MLYPAELRARTSVFYTIFYKFQVRNNQQKILYIKHTFLLGLYTEPKKTWFGAVESLTQLVRKHRHS